MTDVDRSISIRERTILHKEKKMEFISEKDLDQETSNE